MTEGLEIRPHLRQELTCSTWSISWKPVSWRHKGLMHQQPRYWLCWTGMIRSAHAKFYSNFDHKETSYILYHFNVFFRHHSSPLLQVDFLNYMMTSSNGNIFRIAGLCEGNPSVTGRFPSQWPVTRSFDVLFDLCLNERLSKQSRRRWFNTPSRPLWRHCNKRPLMPKVFPTHGVIIVYSAAECLKKNDIRKHKYHGNNYLPTYLHGLISSAGTKTPASSTINRGFIL